MTSELMGAIGELRAEVRGLGRRLDAQEIVIGRIDARGQAIELKLAHDDGRREGSSRMRGLARGERARTVEWLRALIAPAVGAISGALFVRFWP